MDSAQASLTYNSSKLQYLSYSAGSFTTTVSAGNSGSTFSYAGAILGGSTSGDKLMFSVTFKSLAAGTASLSLSGVAVAYSGAGFSPVNTSSGSIVVVNPTTPAPVDDDNDNETNITTVVETKDTEAPKLSGSVSYSVDKTTIKLKFKTNEKSKVQVKYTLAKESKTTALGSFATSFDITLGGDTPLLSGNTYKVEIIATDEAGNKATIYNKNIRTTGVDYQVQITDLDGRPLANHSVALHSDPIETVTDENGYASFSDVAPGDHTLVFDVDGLTMRQAVTVENESLINQSAEQTNSIKLPVRFAVIESEKSKPADNSLVIVAIFCAILGFVLATLIRTKFIYNFFNRLKNLVKRLLTRFKRSN